MEKNLQNIDLDLLLKQINGLIIQSKVVAGRAVNATLTALYWRIGKTLLEQNLEEGKSGYGKQVIANLSTQLTHLYGSGWSQRQLFYCIQLTKTIPDADILHTVCAKLSWSHIRLIIPIDNPLKRDFYLQMAQMEHWSVRTLQERIQSMLILCAGKNSEHIELLRLEQSNIRVAEYLTVLPPKALLEAKLHEAMEKAREQLNQRVSE